MSGITIGYDRRNTKSPWSCRWCGDFDFDVGKSRRYAKSFRLKVEAEQFAAQKKVEFAQGAKRDKPTDIGLHKFCTDCLNVKKSEVRPGTISLYNNTRRRLLDFFGPNMLLSKITSRLADNFIASLKPLNHKEELSTSARHRVLRNCRTLFEKAVTWELIAKNPFKDIKTPKIITRPWHYLTPDEFKKIEQVASLRRRALYNLAYCCGLRLGELLSLTWMDIDLENAEVRIQDRPAAGQHPPFYIKDYESRTIPMPQYCIDILTDLKTYNGQTDQTPYIALDQQQYKTMVYKWQMYRKTKRPWSNRDAQNNTLIRFKEYVKKAKIEPDGTLSIHTLRKCCITNWANEINNPEVVRVLSGHADLKTTMSFYSKVTKEQRVKAAAAIDKLLEKKTYGVTYEGR
jgi:integrase